MARMSGPSRSAVCRTSSRPAAVGTRARRAYTAVAFTGTWSSAWYAAWTVGFTRQTTVAIRSTQVENWRRRSSRCPTVRSNRASRWAGSRAYSNAPRTATAIGLWAMNRSKTASSNIRVPPRAGHNSCAQRLLGTTPRREEGWVCEFTPRESEHVPDRAARRDVGRPGAEGAQGEGGVTGRGVGGGVDRTRRGAAGGRRADVGDRRGDGGPPE